MNRSVLWILVVLVGGSLLLAASTSPESAEPEPREMTFAFWNVENLFDTEDDPANEWDDEFTPENGWNEKVYQKKLDHLAEVIVELRPHLLAVAEVENRRVLEDLRAQPTVAALGYDIIHRDSADRRGIDLALLYRSPCEIADPETDVVLHPLEGDIRGILEVRAQVKGHPLRVFVNHWKSRWGGTEATAPRRQAAARRLRAIVTEADPEADLLILGDLNDEPYSKSVRDTLAAVRSRNAVLNNRKSRYLYNPTWKFFGRSDVGTCYYNRDWVWQLFDQCIVSKGLLLEGGLRFDESSLEIHAPDRMRDKYRRPLRFRIKGKTPVMGYSDHFPIHGRLVW